MTHVNCCHDLVREKKAFTNLDKPSNKAPTRGVSYCHSKCTNRHHLTPHYDPRDSKIRKGYKFIIAILETKVRSPRPSVR